MTPPFITALLIHVALLIVPGFLLLRGVGFSRGWALCLSPAPSVVLLCSVGELFYRAGIGASALLIAGIATAIGAAVLVIGRIRGAELALPEMRPETIALYLVLGIALCHHLFFSRLTYPEELVQAYDLTYHVNLIRNFFDAKVFRPFGGSFYLSEADQGLRPFPGGGGFYPSAWHALCAMVMQLGGVQAPTAINASIYACIAVVLSLGTAALHAIIFEGESFIIRLGAIMTFAFVFFPWTLYLFGPLYPNQFGFTLVPATLAMLAVCAHPELDARKRAVAVGVLLLGVIALAYAHPNCVFTLGLLGAPLLAQRIWEFALERSGGKRSTAALASGAFTVLCCLIWYGLYRAPMLEDLVSHAWPTFASYIQELVNILALSFDYGVNFELAAQMILGPLVIFGFVRAIHSERWRWLAISYALACLVCFAGAAMYGEIKQILAGFWYTDAFRLGSIVCLAGVPLASLGLDWFCSQAVRLVQAYNKGKKETNATKVRAVVCVLFVLLNFYPSFSVPGSHFNMFFNGQVRNGATEEELEGRTEAEKRVLMRRTIGFHTPFGDYREVFDMYLTQDFAIEEREEEFVRQAMEIVPPDALVINNPLDGSPLAYGYFGMRIYYRNFSGYLVGPETDQSRIIRSQLCNYASNEEVRQAVEDIGAEYVLVLSMKNASASYLAQRNDYRPRAFQGISRIDENTPGFELVLSSEDMQLYRIVGVD